jgi:hypothetical protein
MNRTIREALSLFGVMSIFVVSVTFAASGRQMDRSKLQGGARNSGWRILEPVTYENMSVFPVVASNTRSTDEFITLDEGLSSGAVTVSERGAEIMRRSRDGRPAPTQQYGGASVNELVLVNHGNKPLILLAGEMVSGGKQDRIIGKDRIVPVGAEPLPLDVFCVEHGRWSNGGNFSAANTMVHPSVRESAAVAQQQSEVWNSVTRGSNSASVSPGGMGSGNGSAAAPAPVITQRSLGDTASVEAPTVAYDKMYNNSKVNKSLDPFVDEIQRRFARATKDLKGERVVGVVIAYGGEVAWSDIFASPQLFERYWTKLLRSYVVEALARPGTKEVATLKDAEEFLHPLKGTEKIESDPDVYRWREVTQGRYVSIELQALKPADILLHSLTIHKTGVETAVMK